MATVELGDNGRSQYTFMYGDNLGSTNGKKDTIFLGLSTGQQESVTQNNAWDIDGETWFTNGWKPSYMLLGKIDYKQIKAIYAKTYGDKITPTYRAFEGEELRDALFNAQNDVIHDVMEIDIFRGEYNFEIENVDALLYINHYVKSWWVEGFAIDTQRKDSVGFSMTSSIDDDKFVINMGGDVWSREQLNAPSMTHPDWNAPSIGSINWFEGSHQISDFTSQNAYIQTRLKYWDKWSYVLGMRVDISSDLQDSNLFTPQLGIIYFSNKHLTYKLLANQANRTPTANELLGQLEKPDPESLKALELMVQFRYSNLTAELSLYQQKLENQIVFDGVENVYRNTFGSVANGMDWSISDRLTSSIEIYANGIYLFDYKAESGADVLASDFISNEPLNSQGDFIFTPKLSNTLGVTWLAKESSGSRTMVNLDMRNHFGVEYFSDSEYNESSTDAHFVDLGVRYQITKYDMEVAFYAKNLFDFDSKLPAYGEHAAVIDYGTLKPEGRRLWLKLSSKW